LRNLKAPVDMNQQYFGTASADLASEKTNLVELLKQVIASPDDSVLQSHPMYGKLNGNQWGRFMYVHLDHHLRQFGV
jgi:prephenate dehydrogenase